MSMQLFLLTLDVVCRFQPTTHEVQLESCQYLLFGLISFFYIVFMYKLHAMKRNSSAIVSQTLNRGSPCWNTLALF